VHANRDKTGQNFGGRLHEQSALLLGPARALRRVDARSDGNTEVLVRGHRPVGSRRFGKERALDGDSTGRQYTRQGLVAFEYRSELGAPGLLKEPATTRDAARKIAKVLPQVIALAAGEYVSLYEVPFSVKLTSALHAV